MLRLYVDHYTRRRMTDEEWATLRGLAIDGTFFMMARSRRGPYLCRVTVDGIPGTMVGTGPTVGAAIRAVVQQVAA